MKIINILNNQTYVNGTIYCSDDIILMSDDRAVIDNTNETIIQDYNITGDLYIFGKLIIVVDKKLFFKDENKKETFHRIFKSIIKRDLHRKYQRKRKTINADLVFLKSAELCVGKDIVAFYGKSEDKIII